MVAAKVEKARTAATLRALGPYNKATSKSTLSTRDENDGQEIKKEAPDLPHAGRRQPRHGLAAGLDGRAVDVVLRFRTVTTLHGGHGAFGH